MMICNMPDPVWMFGSEFRARVSGHCSSMLGPGGRRRSIDPKTKRPAALVLPHWARISIS